MSEIITSPDFDRIRLGNDRSTEDAIRLLWLMINDLQARIRRLGGDPDAIVEHDLLSSTHPDTSAASPQLGDIIIAAGVGENQDNSKFWGDGVNLGPLLTTEEVGGVKFWGDGGAFEGISAFSGTFWKRLAKPEVEGSVLTFLGGVPTWAVPNEDTESEVAPPAATEPAQARANAANDRLVYSGSTAIKFPTVTIDTDGMRSWVNTPPSGVTSQAFKIPEDGTYTVTVSVSVTDPDDDNTMTLAVVLKSTTSGGVATTLATSNTVTIEDGGTCAISWTGFLDEGVYVEAHRSGQLSGNTSRVNTSSFIEVRGV